YARHDDQHEATHCTIQFRKIGKQNFDAASISLSKNAPLRERRSSFATISLALCFLQAASAAWSCGRERRLPLSPSMYSATIWQCPPLRRCCTASFLAAFALLVGRDTAIGDQFSVLLAVS